MSVNPYESPSTAVLEEARRVRSVLDISQYPTVQQFVHINRLAGLAIAGTGGAVILLAPALWAVEHTAAPVAIGIAVIAVVHVFWGMLQLKRSIAAISFTVVATVGLFGLLISALIRDASAGRLPNSLFAFGIVLGLVCVLLYYSAWLALQAWHWRLQGIDLTALERIEYRQADDSRYVVEPDAPPRGDL